MFKVIALLVALLIALVCLFLWFSPTEGFRGRYYGPGGARAYGYGWYDPRYRFPWIMPYPIGQYDLNYYPGSIVRRP